MSKPVKNVVIQKFVDELEKKGYLYLSDDKIKFGYLLNNEIKSFNKKHSKYKIPTITNNKSTAQINDKLTEINTIFENDEQFIKINALLELRKYIEELKEKDGINIRLDSYPIIRKELLPLIVEIKKEASFFEKTDVIYLASKVAPRLVKDLPDFMNQIKEITDKTSGKVYYRGQQNLNYINEPSVFRKKQWRIHEKDIIEYMLIHNPEDFSNCKTTIEKLTKKQHYQVPTRLMDLTENPFIALYFACEQSTEKINDNKNWGEITLYAPNENCEEKYFDSNTVSILSNLSMMDSNFPLEGYSKLEEQVKLEKNYIDKISDSSVKRNVFVHVKHDNKRITNQQGLFLLFGMNSKKEEPCDVESAYYKNSDGKKIVFFIKNKEELLKELTILNINKGFIYPEIDDYATYLKNDLFGDNK